MLRNLTYRIPIREGADSIGLTRYLELEEGCDVNEEFLIETPRHSIGFIPAELVELRAAIDEMLRMREQHRDALTDGAGVDVRVLGAIERSMLARMARGAFLRYRFTSSECWFAVANGEHRNRPFDAYVNLKSRGLIEPTTQAPETIKRYFISDAGRALLAEQPDPAPDEGESELRIT